MPNLRQLIGLKEKYSNLNSSEKQLKDFINEEFLESEAIQKSFSFDKKFLNENFNVGNAKPNLIKYFESNPTEDVVLLFVDIAGFSNLTSLKTNYFISNYLDNFYKEAFPIIYHHDGQIEKLMGDGIVCVFGSPFINCNEDMLFNKAELCAKELIQRFASTNKKVKVALHNGEIIYYKTPGYDYEEYTMIGKTITELFRLESISRTNAINYFVGGRYDVIRPTKNLRLSKLKLSDVSSFNFDVELQGVQYSKVRYLKFI